MAAKTRFKPHHRYYFLCRVDSSSFDKYRTYEVNTWSPHASGFLFCLLGIIISDILVKLYYSKIMPEWLGQSKAVSDSYMVTECLHLGLIADRASSLVTDSFLHLFYLESNDHRNCSYSHLLPLLYVEQGLWNGRVSVRPSVSPSVCLFHRSRAVMACSGFAAKHPAGRRYRSAAGAGVQQQMRAVFAVGGWGCLNPKLQSNTVTVNRYWGDKCPDTS